jgi:hypothetical protein
MELLFVLRGRIFDVLEIRKNSQQTVRSKVLAMLPTMGELLDSIYINSQGNAMKGTCWPRKQFFFLYKHISSFLDRFSYIVRQFMVLVPRNPTAVNQKGVFCSVAKLFSYEPHVLSSKLAVPLGPGVELHRLLGVRLELHVPIGHRVQPYIPVGVRVRCHVALSLRVKLHMCLPSVRLKSHVSLGILHYLLSD